MAEIARHYTLITLDGVKELIADNVNFECRYELIGHAPNGIPRYSCIYLFDEKEAILVLSRLGNTGGPKTREFNLWPGLFKHHEDFGSKTLLQVDATTLEVTIGPKKI